MNENDTDRMRQIIHDLHGYITEHEQNAKAYKAMISAQAARIKALTDAGRAVVVARRAESVRDGSGRPDQSLPEAIEAFATVLEADSV